MPRTFSPGAILRALPLLALMLAAAPGVRAASAITYPGSGDRVRVGDYLDVRWTGLAGPILIDYQKSGSDTSWWNLSAPSVPAAQGHYNFWQVLDFPGPMRIRITDSTLARYHSETFTVVKLDLTAPGFLTSWEANSTQNITWNHSNNAIPFVKLEYTLNGIDSLPAWVTIRDSVPVSPASFAWTVPGTNSSFARVRIREVHSNSVIHTGNAFAITGGTAVKGLGNGGVGKASGLFGTGARLGFTLSAAAPVRLDALDARGAVVATLVNGRREAGAHVVTLDARRLPAGVYTLRLKAGGEENVRRVVITP